MNRTYLFLLSASMSLSLIGCSNNQQEAAEQGTENAADTMAQSSENAAENTGQAMENAGETVGQAGENAAVGAGQAGEGAIENTADTASNVGVTAKVNNALMLSPITQELVNKINVNTTDTQVILKGHAHSQQQAAEAEKLAKSVAGNRTVVNQIEVMQH